MNSAASIFFYDQATDVQDHTVELLVGLGRTDKSISPKFFYDERGSELFTEITQQTEYYLTRVETSLLQQHAREIGQLIGEESVLIEYGSGSSTKIRILLENLKPSIYAPLDISKDYLSEAAKALAKEYPWLEVHATCVDFTSELELPFGTRKRKVSFFPGSSIGNFEPEYARAFLGRVKKLVGQDGSLLLGVDLKKDTSVLNAAYNDAAGVTAAFNLNVLQHLNDVYSANFDLNNFEHQSAYNMDKGCIEMFLVSKLAQEVMVGGRVFSFSAGERIHTENSYKYTVQEIEKMATGVGFSNLKVWTDPDELFAVIYLT